VCLSVHLHGATQLPAGGYSRDIISYHFLKICQENSSFINPFWSYVRPCPTLWFSCFRRLSWSLTLSNPIFLPPTYSPALIYFGRERGWCITCNYPTVLKEKNINRKSTTCAICWLKSVLHEEKYREHHNVGLRLTWFSCSWRFSSSSLNFIQQIVQVVAFLFVFLF
jgi:hypothetical protein